jgi:hypothetical protein
MPGAAPCVSCLANKGLPQGRSLWQLWFKAQHSRLLLLLLLHWCYCPAGAAVAGLLEPHLPCLSLVWSLVSLD